MVHGRSGYGGDRGIARRWRILAAAICAVVWLVLGAAERACADSRFSVLMTRFVRSYDYLIAQRAIEEARKLTSRPALEPPGGLACAGVRSDSASAAAKPGLDLDPRSDIVALGNSGTLHARLGALAERLEGTAEARPLLSAEADTGLPGTGGVGALVSLSAPVGTTEIPERFAGMPLILFDEELAAIPRPAPTVATDPVDGETMPTPLRIVATALEGVAIVVYGCRVFRR